MTQEERCSLIFDVKFLEKTEEGKRVMDMTKAQSLEWVDDWLTAFEKLEQKLLQVERKLAKRRLSDFYRQLLEDLKESYRTEWSRASDNLRKHRMLRQHKKKNQRRMKKNKQTPRKTIAATVHPAYEVFMSWRRLQLRKMEDDIHLRFLQSSHQKDFRGIVLEQLKKRHRAQRRAQRR